MREIFFYESDFGNKPVEEFLDNLDPEARAKVGRTLELLREQQILPSKFWKKLSGTNLWELRSRGKSGIFRDRAIRERRSGKVSHTEHGGRSGVCDCPSTARSR